MSEQLVFDLPHRPAQDADDFLVSQSNQAAIELIDGWPEAWPNAAALISGPAGSGKSHLVNVWRSRSNADVLHARELEDGTAVKVADCPALVIEDLHEGIANEKSLFYLLNIAREHKRSTLLTSQLAPGDIAAELPDLKSRLRALPAAAISPPDDALLQALLVKLFSDRQLRVDPATIKYILTHMERSAQSAALIVAEMDQLALTMQRKPTKLLAREAIYKLFPIKH